MALVEISVHLKKFLVGLFLTCSYWSFCQENTISPELLKPNPEKEKQFLPYLAVRHGGLETIETWKNNNTYQYYKELWYYCESFYIKRNHFDKGAVLDESIIDISRFEYLRKDNEEAIVTLNGYKDVIVLLPSAKLIYKP